MKKFEYIKDPMRLAIELAKKCKESNDVPVGCTIINEKGELIGSGYNSIIKDDDPIAHAEMLAIKNACSLVGTKNLSKSTMYVSLEPCVMCEAAIYQTKIQKVFFAAYNNSSKKIFNYTKKKYHSERKKFQYYGGFNQEDSEALLKRFFEDLRKKI